MSHYNPVPYETADVPHAQAPITCFQTSWSDHITRLERYKSEIIPERQQTEKVTYTSADVLAKECARKMLPLISQSITRYVI